MGRSTADDVGVTADGMFVAAGAGGGGGGGGGAQQRPSRAARREAEKEEQERAKREKRKAESKRGGSEEKKGGIRLLPTIMLFIMFGPAIFPVFLTGYDFLASTSVGVAIYDSCIDMGVCTTYHDQLKAIYERENPKKVKNVGKLLKKWKGKEAQLIKEVEGKYEQRRRYEAIRKAAMERDKAEHEGTSEEDRGRRSKKKKGTTKQDGPAPPKASGWDDAPVDDAPPEEMWDDEDEDVDDIMAEMMNGDD